MCALRKSGLTQGGVSGGLQRTKHQGMDRGSDKWRLSPVLITTDAISVIAQTWSARLRPRECAHAIAARR